MKKHKQEKIIDSIKELETALWPDPEESIEEAVKILQELEPNLTKKQAGEWVQDRATAIQEARARIFAEMEAEIEKQRADKAEEGIITDHLTGIGNRGAYHQRIDFQISNAERYGRPFALIMADIDHFKRVNDTYGHAMGDKVLKEVARTLKNNLRAVDMVARYGGEEFVVILPDAEMREAGLVAEKLRKAIEEQVRIIHKGESLQINISAGFAEYNPVGLNTADRLQSAADKALYHAKVEGRNRVKAYEKKMTMPEDIKLLKELDELIVRFDILKGQFKYKKEVLGLIEKHKPHLAEAIRDEITHIKKQLSVLKEQIEDKRAEVKKLKKRTA
ncbi:GGDEF domain-containing protein [Candidatus Peregrinibacteria bacterium]|nr:GGDEF domain-containing protein [Candidatus Peregrinibacteria bacterium]